MGKTLEEPLSVADCRRLVGPDCTITDDALVGLRDQVYALARVIVGSTGALSPGEALTDIEERAAILEFDGKLSRASAERAALICVRSSIAASRRKSKPTT